MFHEWILNEVEHRPWPIPSAPWIMQQTWLDLLFAHWPIDPDLLQPHIPPGLVLDTWENQPWLSIVPFRMKNVRPRFVPPVPWLSAFAELNVRTYVRPVGANHHKPGVFFFSLDAANAIAVELARRFFHLPYFNARMSCIDKGSEIHYQSLRTDPRAAQGELSALYGPTGGIRPAVRDTLEYWLAERYALYANDAQGQIYCAEIHHALWPLQPAQADIRINTLAESVGLRLPATPPLLQFSRRQDVLVWPLYRVSATDRPPAG